MIDAMNQDRIAVRRIRTPEGVIFPLLLAGPVTRCLAWSVDLCAVLAVTGIVGQLANFLAVFSRDLSMAIYTIAYFLVSLGYGIALEWFWRGQTLGKRLLRLRVMDAEGFSLRFNQILTRNLMRVVDVLPVAYLVGGVTCLLSRNYQRLGDMVGNTIVVRQPRQSEPNLDNVLTGKFNSLLTYPHLAARLRQKTSPREAHLALEALLRREALEPEARLELFTAISRLFQDKVPFPEPATYGLTDEQYLRNVVEILFRPVSVGHRS